jgi:hypothetical protein
MTRDQAPEVIVSDWNIEPSPTNESDRRLRSGDPRSEGIKFPGSESVFTETCPSRRGELTLG